MTPAVSEEMVERAQFLIDRLDEWERDLGETTDVETDYIGHVHPAKERLRAAISAALPLPVEGVAVKALEAALACIDGIEKAAFRLPPPNALTPEIVGFCVLARSTINDALASPSAEAAPTAPPASWEEAFERLTEPSAEAAQPVAYPTVEMLATAEQILNNQRIEKGYSLSQPQGELREPTVEIFRRFADQFRSGAQGAYFADSDTSIDCDAAKALALAIDAALAGRTAG
jgi:hypothetical protein